MRQGRLQVVSRNGFFRIEDFVAVRGPAAGIILIAVAVSPGMGPPQPLARRGRVLIVEIYNLQNWWKSTGIQINQTAGLMTKSCVFSSWLIHAAENCGGGSWRQNN